MSMINEEQRMLCAPPRVLYTAAEGWAIPEAQRPLDWRERVRARDAAPEPVKCNRKPYGAIVRVREVVKPTAPVKPTGRGLGWRLKTNITAAKVVELRRQHGWGMERIAAHLRCSYCAVRSRLRDEPALLAEFVALARKCSCGVEIRTEHQFCAVCRFNRPAQVREAMRAQKPKHL